jgi:hypothetical protein
MEEKMGIRKRHSLRKRCAKGREGAEEKTFKEVKSSQMDSNRSLLSYLLTI